MKQKNIKLYVILIIIQFLIHSRSVYRPEDPQSPEIITYWSDGLENQKKYSLKHSRLEYVPLFKKFDKEFFYNHILPDENIIFRNHIKKSVPGKKLKKLLEGLITEVMEQKMVYKDFTILKNRDFNRKDKSGLLIVKFKDYPFVVKIFMENPQSFVQPFSKGFEPSIFFVMGGGINRYLSGFTRIKNLEVINKEIQSHPYWKNKLSTPRKWYGLSEQTRWFTVEGKNLGKSPTTSINLPSIYYIVSDFIDADENFSIFKKKNRKAVIELSKFLGNRIDPHIDNYMFEKKTGLMVIVDSEHFPTMVGLKKPLEFNSYAQWYSRLMAKCLKDTLGRDKKTRRIAQFNEDPEFLPV